MVSFGGDEGVAIIEPRFEHELEELRAKYQQISGFSCTMGVGLSLSQAGKSLLAGKNMGKDQIVRYDASVEETLKQMHEHPDSEEAEKINDHYLNHVMGDENGEEMLEEPAMDPEASDEDMMQAPEDAEMGMDPGYDFQEGEPGSEEPMDPDMMSPDDMGSEDMLEPIDDEDMEIEQAPQDPEASEEMIELPMSDEAEEQIAGEEPEEGSVDPEKSIAAAAGDEMDPEMSEEQDPQAPEAEMQPEGQDDMSELEGMLADDGSMGDVRAKIAQNLEQFKQNKDLLEQVRTQNPELYASILSLFQNLIELARSAGGEPAPEEDTQDPAMMDQEEEDPSLPKQNG